RGWHKLVFDQGGAKSRAIFVSIGIHPPTVVFPRNGAEIDCKQPDPQGDLRAFGTIPYPQTGDHSFGRLRVMEETGRTPLGFVGARGINGGIFLAGPPPIQNPGTIPINIGPCPNAQNAFCAEADADVNIRVGTRLYTTRAKDDGTWTIDLPLGFGWNEVTFS